MTDLAGRLPNEVEHTPADTLPIERVAYNLYGDPERSEEILLRNPDVSHPGFIPGRVALKVLSK